MDPINRVILTSQQMRDIEHNAIKEGHNTGIDMMEEAGRAVFDTIEAHYPRFNSALVLVGPGNNGGDGYVVARLLAERNKQCTVATIGDHSQLPPDAKKNYDLWRRPSVPLAQAKPADIIVDALFGTGLIRSLSDDVITALKSIAQWNNPTIAIDIPSGLNSDTGNVLGYALKANHTVTFHRAKLGHYLAGGPDICGRLHVVNIGLDQPNGNFCRLIAAPDNLNKTSGHKYDYGHSLIISGTKGRTGAARLAAMSALRAGSGLVTIAAPKTASDEIANQITSLMLTTFNDGPNLQAQIKTEQRWNALCIGPGLGLEESELVSTILKARRPTVLDADALSIVANESFIRELVHPDCILTPHEGEFARLFPDIAGELKMGTISKVVATERAAKELNATILLKGRDSIIANPDKTALHCAAYERAAPWLATAGSGDVLSGIIAGLLARGFSPFNAACSAAWLHTEAAIEFGPGLIAEDIAPSIAGVMRRIYAPPTD